MGPPRPNLTLVPAVPVAPTSKSFSFDMVQFDEGSGMVTIDACVPMSVAMQMLKLLEPFNE